MKYVVLAEVSGAPVLREYFKEEDTAYALFRDCLRDHASGAYKLDRLAWGRLISDGEFETVDWFRSIDGNALDIADLETWV